MIIKKMLRRYCFHAIDVISSIAWRRCSCNKMRQLRICSQDIIENIDQDMETLADLTKRAKGDERSINEFARVCGVSPSTISRLINKKNTTPNKDSLIKAIADNAVPESGVTLDMLLQAHGLEKISVYEGKERKSESVLEDIVIDRLLCDITQLGYKCEIEKEKKYYLYYG